MHNFKSTDLPITLGYIGGKLLFKYFWQKLCKCLVLEERSKTVSFNFTQLKKVKSK